MIWRKDLEKALCFLGKELVFFFPSVWCTNTKQDNMNADNCWYLSRSGVISGRLRKVKSHFYHCNTVERVQCLVWAREALHSDRNIFIYFAGCFCPKGSGAWWVCNQQALSGLSLYIAGLSLMCAAVNMGRSLPSTISWGMRLSTRALMSTLDGIHGRKTLQL